MSIATSITVSDGNTTSFITCTTPLSDAISAVVTLDWLANTPSLFTDIFIVLVVLTGWTIWPLVNVLETTSDPITW